MSEKQEAILPVVPLVPGNEPTGRPLVELTHVEKYFGDLHVLKDINLTVNKGEVLVVVGPSGSGKSTMCRTINRLETIESGDIRIDGKALPQEGRQLAQLRAEVGMVFQSFNLFANKTILENVTLAPIKVRHMDKKEAERLAMDLLTRVGVDSQASKMPSQLSGGQQQRVAIARALITKPKLVFADEPTGNLDSVSSAEVLGFLKRSVNELGQTIVMVTHDAVAASYADRAIVFSDGRIVADEQHPNAEVMNELLMAERERTTRTTLTDTPADQMAQMAGVRNVPDLPITDAPLPPAVPTSGCEGTLRHARAAARHAR